MKRRSTRGLVLTCLTASVACSSPLDPAPLADPPDDDPGGSETVSFPGPDFSLVGTLTLPPSPEGTPLPGVVLIHGSGPNSRDLAATGQLGLSFGFTIEVFAELAQALAEGGYAVLRYDKRTCGTFNGRCSNGYPAPASSLTVRDFQADAAAAVAYLRTRSEIDGDRVTPIGLSQGAEFVAPLLQGDVRIPHGVMLGGPYRPIDALLGYQLERTTQLLSESGQSPDEIEAAVEGLQAIVNQLEELREGTFSGSEIGGIAVEFWTSWTAMGDTREADVRALDRPILALSGGYDWNVPPSETESFGALFAQLPAVAHDWQVVPCVTHVLNCITQPDWKLITTPDIGRHVHPPVVEAILAFLQ